LVSMLSTPATIVRAWDEKEQRELPDKRPLKGWSVATFAGETRKKRLCEAVTALVLDYDGGTSIDQAVALWGSYAGFLHTSPKHRFEEYGDRFRLVLRFSRPVIPTAEYERIWAWSQAKCKGTGHKIDLAPKDPSRLWFLPGRLHGAPF